MSKFIEVISNGNKISVRKSDISIVWAETPYQDCCIELVNSKKIVTDYSYNALMRILGEDDDK